MQRQIFTQEQDEFRDMVRAFIAKEITPYHEQWERDGIVSRDVWLAAGRAGLLGIHIDEKYGGGGDPDYRYYVVLNEELARAGASGPMFQLHNDMIGPYLDRLCTPEQRERWLPGYCSGELVAAIAKSKEMPFGRVLVALGIEEVGGAASTVTVSRGRCERATLTTCTGDRKPGRARAASDNRSAACVLAIWPAPGGQSYSPWLLASTPIAMGSGMPSAVAPGK